MGFIINDGCIFSVIFFIVLQNAFKSIFSDKALSVFSTPDRLIAGHDNYMVAVCKKFCICYLAVRADTDIFVAVIFR